MIIGHHQDFHLKNKTIFINKINLFCVKCLLLTINELIQTISMTFFYLPYIANVVSVFFCICHSCWPPLLNTWSPLASGSIVNKYVFIFFGGNSSSPASINFSFFFGSRFLPIVAWSCRVDTLNKRSFICFLRHENLLPD